MNLLGNLYENEDSTQITEGIDQEESTQSVLETEKTSENEEPQPKIQVPNVEDEEEREDLSIEDTENLGKNSQKEVGNIPNCTFGEDVVGAINSDESNFVGEKIDQDLSRYDNIERIKEYLENEIGKDILSKAHPILREFGDDILYENNIPNVIQKLKGIVSEDEVVKYLHFFATLIFFENQADNLKDKIKKDTLPQKEDKKEEKRESKKISNQRTKPDFAFQSFKDQPKEEEEVDNIFKKYSNQNPNFDVTANFGFK